MLFPPFFFQYFLESLKVKMINLLNEDNTTFLGLLGAFAASTILVIPKKLIVLITLILNLIFS